PPLCKPNSASLYVLASFRPYAVVLLVPTVLISAVVTAKYLRRGSASTPKQLYLASTAAMFAWAILVDPVAGLAGYAGAHAVEYFFIVDHRLSADHRPSSRRNFFVV